MKITLLPQEKALLKQYAEEYRTKTGDNYSYFHMMSILTSFYEERFEKDLQEVMDIKLREFQEGKWNEQSN